MLTIYFSLKLQKETREPGDGLLSSFVERRAKNRHLSPAGIDLFTLQVYCFPSAPVVYFAQQPKGSRKGRAETGPEPWRKISENNHCNTLLSLLYPPLVENISFQIHKNGRRNCLCS